MTNHNSLDKVQLVSYLNEIQSILNKYNLLTTVEDCDLSSTEPFALDKLSYNQWLEHVFLVKMRHLAEQEQQASFKLNITPYFEEAITDVQVKNELVAKLKELEYFFNSAS